MSIHRILVPVDFSETSTDALRLARDIARAMDARLVLLHVTPDPSSQPWVDVPLDFNLLRMEWQEEARRRLQALIDLLGITGREATIDVSAGYPPSIILRAASEHDVDLIVLGTHGHGPARRFLLGSVADRVTQRASCPVLTIPPRALRQPAVLAGDTSHEAMNEAHPNRG